MTISNVQAGTAVYNAVNANAKPAISAGLESNSSISTNSVDSVTISDAAKVANLGYNFSYDEVGFQLFEKWQNSSEAFMKALEEKSVDQLLPESQHLIEHFQEKIKSASSTDEREQLLGKISHIRIYGNEIPFKNEFDLDAHRKSTNIGMSYLFHDINQNPEKYPNVKNNSEEILRDLGFRFDLL